MLSIRRLPFADVAAAFELERASYPADEAATLEKLQMRAKYASEYFYGGYDDDGLLKSFVCGTLTNDGTITAQSMSTHEPTGTTLCIHSVVVSPELRRQGVGTSMLNAFVALVAEKAHAHRILLLCKRPLVGFYESVGFTKQGESSVQHGQDKWMLMAKFMR